MTEGNKIFNELINIKYSFNYRYGITFLKPLEFNKALEYTSKLRRLKFMDIEDLRLINKILNIHGRNHYRIKQLEDKEPRIIAQKFISKKNVRSMIFKRDGYVCLRCNSIDNLTIYHIIPINRGGENKIGNLQILCRSCNSKKSDTYKDYRK